MKLSEIRAFTPHKIGISLINLFTDMREPVKNPPMEELNKIPPQDGWGRDGYNTLKLDPTGGVFDKVV